MERQPIDDLFSRKLQNAEVRPGGDAWARLQAKQGVSRATPLWRYMAVAASLLSVSLFGWWAIPARYPKEATIVSTDKRNVPTHSEQIAKVEPTGVKQTQVNENGISHLVGNIASKRVERVAFAASKDGSTKQEMRNVVIEPMTTIQEPIVAADIAKQDKSSDSVEDNNPSIALAKETAPEIHSPVAERILVVSIAANPVVQVGGVVEAPVVSKQNNKGGGLGGFLRKVKRLKEGEALALNTEATNKTDHHGLTKVLDEVKESIRNNATEK